MLEKTNQENQAKMVIALEMDYNRICLVGHLSDRTVLPKIFLTGQFDFQNCLSKQNPL